MRGRRRKKREQQDSARADIYRQVRTTPSTERSGPDRRVRSAIEAHYEATFGPDRRLFHEPISDPVHLDIAVWDPTDDRPMYALATLGMSDLPMAVPAEERSTGSPDRAELVMCLPARWPVPAGSGADAAWKDDDAFLPIRWLKILARIPHEYDTWLAIGHSVPNGDPPVPFTDFTRLCGWVLLPPMNVPESFDRIEVPGVGPVAFYGAYALHADELEMKLAHGVQSLIEGFERHDVTELLLLDRPSSLRES